MGRDSPSRLTVELLLLDLISTSIALRSAAQLRHLLPLRNERNPVVGRAGVIGEGLARAPLDQSCWGFDLVSLSVMDPSQRGSRPIARALTSQALRS